MARQKNVYSNLNSTMNILGLDTSCDDTSASVVADGHNVLSNVINSQIKLHHVYGGVVPELASREHIRNIAPVVDEALSRAGIGVDKLDGIAVTTGPGLIGSLLVGLYYAKGLAMVRNVPMIGVNHLEGHILSVLLEDDPPDFPFVALTVSGGHTSLYHVKGLGQYTQMGQTLDDAAGEAYDKVAKILGLGYPGGAVIENIALSGKKDKINFPRAQMSQDSLDFSFSGLKTAVSMFINKWKQSEKQQAEIMKEDIAASFQEAVIDVLAQKFMRAAEREGVDSLVLAGGVACNKALRQRLTEETDARGMNLFYPRPAYCTDNGAMIALAGHYRIMRGERSSQTEDVRSRYPIEEIL
jgi:N6-L-threonylcarbamoyladenine synthase